MENRLCNANVELPKPKQINQFICCVYSLGLRTFFRAVDMCVGGSNTRTWLLETFVCISTFRLNRFSFFFDIRGQVGTHISFRIAGTVNANRAAPYTQLNYIRYHSPFQTMENSILVLSARKPGPTKIFRGLIFPR